ncbi:MAG: hypothetical protein RLZZ221_1155 [Verrucomicrobiota bacterium]
MGRQPARSLVRGPTRVDCGIDSSLWASGTGRPAATLAAYDVTTALLAHGAVTTQTFAAGGVTSDGLADGSVTAAPFAEGAINGECLGSEDVLAGPSLLVILTTGQRYTAPGTKALLANSSGDDGTTSGTTALLAITTAIGFGATESASNSIRLGNSSVTSITGQVAFPASADRTKKEGFPAVDGDEVLGNLRTLEVTISIFRPRVREGTTTASALAALEI